MTSQAETRQELIREQSAALNQELSGTPAGASGSRGGSAPLPPTRFERQMLDALADGKPRRPDELIAAYPSVFGARSVASLHLTAASLVRKGWATRHKRTHQGTYRRSYRITEAGKRA